MTPPWSSLSNKVIAAYAFAIIAAALWGSNAVAARMAALEIPPITMTFWRTLCVVVVLLPFTAREVWLSRARLRRRWRLILGLAILGPVGLNLFLYHGLQTTNAINGALLNSAMPVTTVLASWLLVGETISRRIAFGMALALIGVAIIVLRGDLDALRTFNIGIGDPMIIAGMSSWAAFSVYLRKRHDGLGASAFVVVITAVSATVMLPFYLWDLARGSRFEVTLANISLILYAAAVVSVFANICWIRSVEAIGANTAGQFNYLIPLVGSVLALIILDERFHLFHGAGMAMILLGVYFATSRNVPR